MLLQEMEAELSGTWIEREKGAVLINTGLCHEYLLISIFPYML